MRRATHAFVGRKPCGCPTFARLAVPFNAAPLEKAARGLRVTRVPLDQAQVVICKCD